MWAKSAGAVLVEGRAILDKPGNTDWKRKEVLRVLLGGLNYMFGTNALGQDISALSQLDDLLDVVQIGGIVEARPGVLDRLPRHQESKACQSPGLEARQVFDRL